MANFKPLFGLEDKQPKSQFVIADEKPLGILEALKDQLHFTSWLAIGGCLQVLLYLAIGSLAFFLPPLILIVRALDAVLQTYGLRRNPHMDGVIKTKFSAQIPNPDGSFSAKPASDQVTVFLIGAKNNHPLGPLGPGVLKLIDYFERMIKELEADPAEYGYLGTSQWTSNERTSSNEVMNLMYFRSAEGIHKYAHSELHREGWNWWNATVDKHDHIAIWHELFVAPAGKWETIYVNDQPSLLAGTVFPIKTESGTKWQRPIVDATKGVLRSSRGRMTMTDGADNERYGVEPYGA